jgi:AraC family transcriptional regulator
MNDGSNAGNAFAAHADDVPQHTLRSSVALHLLPGALVFACYLSAAPSFIHRGVPPGLALLLGFLFVGIPIELGYLLYLGKRRNGALTPHAGLDHRRRLMRQHARQPVVEVASGVLGGVSDPTILAGPFAVTLTKLPPRLHLPPHAHEQATLNVVLDGEYGETVERGAFQSHGPATLIAKPAGTVHGNQLVSAPVECLVIEVGADTVEILRQSVPLFSQVVVQRSAQVARYGGRLRAELARRDDVTPLAVEGLVCELLAELARAPQPRPDARNRWLTCARDLMHDEPGPQSLSDLARRLGLHPIYVARAFRARFGCAVGDYARCLRVERARRLLHHTPLGLSEVAVRAGYSDQSHMTRDFRRAFDQSPGAYRRLTRGH